MKFFRKIWLYLIKEPKKKPEPRRTVMLSKLSPETLAYVPPQEFKSAIREDYSVGHINFKKVKQITRKYKRETTFYDEEGNLRS